MADEIGLKRPVDVSELIYNDPLRADVAEWLSANGWEASATPSNEEMRRLDRWIEVPDTEQRDAFSTFVVAERLP
jgi:O-methyltransferase involved in polyketide biosynthesis